MPMMLGIVLQGSDSLHKIIFPSLQGLNSTFSSAFVSITWSSSMACLKECSTVVIISNVYCNGESLHMFLEVPVPINIPKIRGGGWSASRVGRRGGAGEQYLRGLWESRRSTNVGRRRKLRGHVVPSWLKHHSYLNAGRKMSPVPPLKRHHRWVVSNTGGILLACPVVHWEVKVHSCSSNRPRVKGAQSRIVLTTLRAGHVTIL